MEDIENMRSWRGDDDVRMVRLRDANTERSKSYQSRERMLLGVEQQGAIGAMMKRLANPLFGRC